MTISQVWKQMRGLDNEEFVEDNEKRDVIDKNKTNLSFCSFRYFSSSSGFTT